MVLRGSVVFGTSSKRWSREEGCDLGHCAGVYGITPHVVRGVEFDPHEVPSRPLGPTVGRMRLLAASGMCAGVPGKAPSRNTLGSCSGLRVESVARMQQVALMALQRRSAGEAKWGVCNYKQPVGGRGCMFRGTSLTRTRTPLGPYRRPRVLGGWAFSHGRGTHVD